MNKILLIFVLLASQLFGQTYLVVGFDTLWIRPSITFQEPVITSTNETNEVAHYNMQKIGTTLVDISGNGNTGTVTGTYQTNDGLKHDGADDKVVLGNIGNVKSMAFRIKLSSTTEQILEGAANDKLIHVSSGTLTYTEFDDAFIDGVNTNTMVADQWHNVMIVSSSNVDMSAVTLALNNAAYGDFEINDLKFYSDEKALADGIVYHNGFADNVALLERFEGKTLSVFPDFDWVAGTGSFTVVEGTIGSVTQNVLNCSGNGTISLAVNLNNYIDNGQLSYKFKDGTWSTITETVDASSRFSYSNGILTLTGVSGKRYADIVITQGVLQ